MRTKSLLLAACLSLTPLTVPAAMAQGITGSGVVPSTVANSAERPMGFAASAPAKGVLVVLMADATLPSLDAVGVGAGERSAIEAAIASAKFEGKANATLSLR